MIASPQVTDLEALSLREAAKEFARQCGESEVPLDQRREFLREIVAAEHEAASLRNLIAEARGERANVVAAYTAEAEPLRNELADTGTPAERRVAIQSELFDLRGRCDEATAKLDRRIAALEGSMTPASIRASARQNLEAAARRTGPADEQIELATLEKCLERFAVFMLPYEREADTAADVLKDLRQKKLDWEAHAADRANRRKERIDLADMAAPPRPAAPIMYPSEIADAERRALRSQKMYERFRRFKSDLEAERAAIHARRLAELYAADPSPAAE